ncbi:MAG: toll/interleukin-1 receptor domain-containing protein [Dokdonella sp.]
MDVFLSWSGTQSKAVASALRTWLPDVMQWVKPWMSAEDINAGSRWSNEIEGRLRESKFGIICLTATNQTAPWILFEAGAIAKSIADQSFICPLLIRFGPSALAAGPLAQFQAKTLDQAGMLAIVQSINVASGDRGLLSKNLERSFATWWPALEDALNSLPDDAAQSPTRSPESMIEEILEATRSIKSILQREATPGAVFSTQGSENLIAQAMQFIRDRPATVDREVLRKYEEGPPTSPRHALPRAE